LQRFVFKPLAGRKGSIAWILGVVVFAAVLRNVAGLVFESRAYEVPYAHLGRGVLVIGGGSGLVIRTIYLWVFAAAALAAIAMELMLGRSAFGRSIRAVAESRPTAELMGIDTERVLTLTFAIAAALGALAGALIAPITFVSVALGSLFTLKGFVAAVLGGLGRGRGALLGGLILGCTEQLLGALEFLVPHSLGRFFTGGYRDAFAFVILIIVLIVRPRGLLGPPSRVEA
ncbi:MAG: hypothetical protein LC723_04335, partial [Actinobacteria bacterium]|nr:hypothetical protein [Actinomycetota bacterium]